MNEAVGDECCEKGTDRKNDFACVLLLKVVHVCEGPLGQVPQYLLSQLSQHMKKTNLSPLSTSDNSEHEHDIQ